MKKKDMILEKFPGFKPASLSHGRRDPKSRDPKSITTLALSAKGRLTIPSSVWDYYKFDGSKHFIARYNSKKNQLLIILQKEPDSESKSITGLRTPTKYCEIRPQLQSWEIDFENIAAVTFSVEEKVAIILDFNKTLPRA